MLLCWNGEQLKQFGAIFGEMDNIAIRSIDSVTMEEFARHFTGSQTCAWAAEASPNRKTNSKES